jgi:iron complex outermembrane recepter protein
MPELTRRPLFPTATACALSLLVLLLANAQRAVGGGEGSSETAGSTALPASDTNAPTRLPTVIVVAQKQPAELQGLPVSVTPVAAQTLQDADVRFVKEAELYAPNVFLNEFSARKLSNPYFRGVGSSPNNPGVTTYIDGVPQLNANSSSLELVDVEQLEFVRGPQGALFGRNTVGGLINITSRRPSPVWQSELQTEFGNYDYQDVRLRLSGPVAQDLGLSLAGGYSARDGFTENDVTGHRLDSRQAFFGKGQLLWMPLGTCEARLIVSGESARDGDYALGDLDAIRARPHHVAHNFEGFTHRDLIAPTLVLDHNGPAVDLALISGVVWWKTQDATDLDYSPVPAATRQNTERDVQVTEEFRAASAKDAPLTLAEDYKLRWQTGLAFFSQNYDQDAVNAYAPGVLYQPGQFGSGIPPTASPANAQHAPVAALDDIGLGAYAQLTLAAWEKLDLSAGVHGDYEHKAADLRTFFATPDPFLGPRTSLNASRDFCEASPQVSLAWHILPDKTAYATFGRGYKAGGFNPTSPPGREAYDAESSWNYEIGAKTAWFNDRLVLNVAAFYIDWRNLQLNLPTTVPGQYFIANAGGADSKGVELELRARPRHGWDLFATFGYTDARYLSGATAAHTAPSGNSTRVDIGGNHLIFSPEFTASGGTEYSWAICQRAALYVRAEVAVYGRYFYDPANTASQDTYSLANFRAGIRGNRWFAEGWVRNAFDTHYVPIAFEFPNQQSGFVGESGAPVTFGVRAGVEL